MLYHLVLPWLAECWYSYSCCFVESVFLWAKFLIVWTHLLIFFPQSVMMSLRLISEMQPWWYMGQRLFSCHHIWHGYYRCQQIDWFFGKNLARYCVRCAERSIEHRFWPFWDPLVVNQRFTRCCDPGFRIVIPASNQSGFCLHGGVVDGVSNDVPSLLDTSRFSSTVLAERVHRSGSLVPAVLIRGCPFCLERWVRSDWRHTLVPTSEWCVLRTAMW